MLMKAISSSLSISPAWWLCGSCGDAMPMEFISFSLSLSPAWWLCGSCGDAMPMEFISSSLALSPLLGGFVGLAGAAMLIKVISSLSLSLRWFYESCRCRNADKYHQLPLSLSLSLSLF